MEEQTCKDCRFRVERQRRNCCNREETSGLRNAIECHRHSPRDDQTWPEVDDYEWCGEFELKASEKNIPTADIQGLGFCRMPYCCGPQPKDESTLDEEIWVKPMWCG